MRGASIYTSLRRAEVCGATVDYAWRLGGACGGHGASGAHSERKLLNFFLSNLREVR